MGKTQAASHYVMERPHNLALNAAILNKGLKFPDPSGETVTPSDLMVADV